MGDFRELHNRLRGRGAADECTICGAARWMPGGAGVLLLTVHEDRQPAVELDRGLECQAWICTSCGYVRLHAPQILDDPRLRDE